MPDIRRGEYVTGFYVRAGFWIDGIQIFTSSGRKSPVYGKPNGGSGYVVCDRQTYSFYSPKPQEKVMLIKFAAVQPYTNTPKGFQYCGGNRVMRRLG